MSRAFNISSPGDAVRIDSHGRGEVAFTVTNTSARAVRGRFKVKLLDQPGAGGGALGADAFVIGGEPERSFNPNDTQQVPVRIELPAGTREGKHSFRLDAINVDSPDEDFTEGPALAIDVKGAPAERNFPWWIVAVLLLVLVVGGGVGYMIMNRMGTVELPLVTGKSYGEASEQLGALGLVATRTPLATGDAPAEQVIAQSPPALQKVRKGSEVALTVAEPVKAPPVPADLFAGNWVNKDSNTNDITRVNIQHAGNVYKVRVFGKCTPQDCDWGVEQASRNQSELNLKWNQGFVVRQMNIRRNGNELIVTTDSNYTDTRPSRHSVQTFVRAGLPLAGSVKVREGLSVKALEKLLEKD